MKTFAVAYHINSGTNGIYFVCANQREDLTKDALDELTIKETKEKGVPKVVVHASTDYMIEELGENMKSPYVLDKK